jgi:hypothetical protein
VGSPGAVPQPYHAVGGGPHHWTVGSHCQRDSGYPASSASGALLSQVCIQRLQKMIQHYTNCCTATWDIHADHTRCTAELMLYRAERGVESHILNVKSHTGILGIEEADKAAKKAAKWPDLCEYKTPAHNPFEGKTWLVYKSSPKLPLTGPPTSGQLPTLGEASHEPLQK